jgi:DNA helicase-2/ATP-dependent DNA helicase PcrA
LQLIFKEYNALLRQKEYYDFNDMINFVLEQFGKDEDLKYYYAEKFQFIMLDEYQDTNNAQNEIVEAILSLSVDENPNILVV